MSAPRNRVSCLTFFVCFLGLWGAAGCKKAGTTAAGGHGQYGSSTSATAKSDAEAILGQWMVVSGSEGTKTLTRDDKELHEPWSFQGGLFSISGHLAGRYDFLQDKTPKQIDLSFQEGHLQLLHAIYELSGDELKVAFTEEGAPADFTATAVKKVLVFHRSGALAGVPSTNSSRAAAFAAGTVPSSQPGDRAGFAAGLPATRAAPARRGPQLAELPAQAFAQIWPQFLEHWRVLPAPDLDNARWRHGRGEFMLQGMMEYDEATIENVTCNTELGGEEGKFLIVQRRSLTCQIRSQPLTEANILNGVQWVGTVSIDGGPVSRSGEINVSEQMSGKEPHWEQWSQGVTKPTLHSRSLVKTNGIWKILDRDVFSQPPDDGKPYPMSAQERAEMHLGQSMGWLSAGRWGSAVAEAQMSLAWNDATPRGAGNGPATNRYGTAERVLVNVLEQFTQAKQPDPALATAAARAADTLTQRDHPDVATLSLPALNRLASMPQLEGAGAYARAMSRHVPAERDEKAVAVLRAFMQSAVARGALGDDDCRSVAKALAALDTPEWDGFVPFNASAVMTSFKEAWWSADRKMQSDPIDRDSDSLPLMQSLFKKLGPPDVFGHGRGGVTIGNNVTTWLNGPQSATLRGSIVTQNLDDQGSFMLDLKPGKGGRWLIAGIRDIVLRGEAVTVTAVPADSKGADPRTKLPPPASATQPASARPVIAGNPPSLPDKNPAAGITPRPAPAQPPAGAPAAVKRPEPSPEAVAAYDRATKAMQGFFPNWSEVAKGYRKAADLGHPRAAAALGVLYIKGSGVEKDAAEALKLFKQAADAGDDLGQTWLGHVYEDGLGVAADGAQAVKWYTAAADQGNKEAQVNLGDIYLAGKIVPKDAAIAVSLYRKAADKGFAAAQNRLGQVLYEGRGVARDRVEGAQWLRKASQQNDIEAKLYMKLQNIR